MNASSTTGSAPAGRFRVWRRRVLLAVACLPLAAASVLHTMGRSGDFGLLGRWYVLTGLTVVSLLAWLLLEKTIARTVPAAPED